MRKEVKDFNCYATAHQKEFIKKTYEEMVKLIPDFSRLQASRSGFNFTEYSMLYRDLYVFYNNEMLTRGIYKVKDILSFRNSFELIYNNIKRIESLEHVTIHVFFKTKLDIFERWLNEIIHTAEARLERE